MFLVGMFYKLKLYILVVINELFFVFCYGHTSWEKNVVQLIYFSKCSKELMLKCSLGTVLTLSS